MAMKGNKEMMTISLTPDTKGRLRAYAEQNHKSVSQAITDWVWSLPVQEDGKDRDKIKEETNDD